MALWTFLNQGHMLLNFALRHLVRRMIPCGWFSISGKVAQWKLAFWLRSETQESLIWKMQACLMNTGFFSLLYFWLCLACLQEVAFKQQCGVAINICMKGPTFSVWILSNLPWQTELSFQSWCLSFITRINCTPRTGEQGCLHDAYLLVSSLSS